MNKIDSYKVVDGHLIIQSKSGNTYRLNKTFCSCKGFGFRRTCGHIQDAEDNGLFKLLEAKPITKVQFLRSPYISKVRKEAIKKFLIKLKIKVTSGLVDQLELKVNTNMTVDKFTKLARSLLV